MPESTATSTPSCTPPPPPKGCELLRGNVFESGRHADVDEVRVRRRPTMTHFEDRLVAPPVSTDKKYTLVLDLDETVVYAREGPLYARAYLRELLRSIKDEFEVIVWTAGEREYAKSILEEINEDHIIQHLVYRHKTWFSTDDYTKDIRKLGRNIDYVIMVENTPACVRANPRNGIIVEDFEVPSTTPTASQENTAAAARSFSSPNSATMTMTTTTTTDKPRRQLTDRTLLLLQEVLTLLAQSGETVPEFLANCPLLSRQEAQGADGSTIPTYFLGKRRRRGAPRSALLLPALRCKRAMCDPRAASAGGKKQAIQTKSGGREALRNQTA